MLYSHVTVQFFTRMSLLILPISKGIGLEKLERIGKLLSKPPTSPWVTSTAPGTPTPSRLRVDCSTQGGWFDLSLMFEGNTFSPPGRQVLPIPPSVLNGVLRPASGHSLYRD